MRIGSLRFLTIVLLTVIRGHAGEAIARWAFPDFVSTCDTVHIGLVAYASSGIDRIEFRVDAGAAVTVAGETVNPCTGEYEYVLTVAAGELAAGPHTVGADVYPVDGATAAMDPLTLDVVTGMSFGAVTVDPAGGADYTTLEAAMNAVSGGDTIYLADGEYTVPDSWTPTYDRWIFIKPASGAEPAITNGPNLRKGFLKCESLTFDARDMDPGANIMGTYSAGNFWYDGCRIIGVGKENYNNGQTAFRMRTDNARNVVIENCDIDGVGRGFVVQGPQSIIRNNRLGNLASDTFNPGGEILITGNEAYGTQAAKLFLESSSAPPFDFSVGKYLMISHCEATNSCDSADYYVYEIADMGAEAADPSATTMQEAIAALNADTAFFTYCWAEERDGHLRIYSRRSNYVQQMWVTGSANDILGIPENSLADEAEGAGAHADLVQYWGSSSVTDTLRDFIFRNNRTYHNNSQGLFPGGDIHTLNAAFVNNLVDAASKSGWNCNFSGSRTPGEHFENVLFEFNTIWDRGQALLFANDSAQVDVVMRNNVFGRRALGSGDRTAAGFTMDYNYWISYYARPTNMAAHSIYQEVTEEETGGLFTFCTYNAETGDDTSDFVPAENSPLRNAGTAAAGIPYDIGWNPRDDALPDMGCTEYREAGAVRSVEYGVRSLRRPFPVTVNPVSVAQVRALGADVRLLTADGVVIPAALVAHAGMYYIRGAAGVVWRIVVVE